MTPRIEPVSLDDADTRIRELFDRIPEPMRTLNVFRTFARHPDLMRPWLAFGGYLPRATDELIDRQHAIVAGVGAVPLRTTQQPVRNAAPHQHCARASTLPSRGTRDS